METIQITLLLLVFVFLAVLMFLRKLPAIIALPVMAFLIPVIAGVSVSDTIQYVLGLGSTRLSEAYTIAIFGSMLSILMQKTGIAESFIKIGAELSGDKPWTIAIIMLVTIALLFTTLGGLGAIIMVATVVLPIMTSAGMSSLTVSGIFLIGLSMGGALNPGNWAVYITVLGLTVDEVRNFAFFMFGITFVAAVVYISVQLYRDGHVINFRKIILRSLTAAVLISLIIILYNFLSLEIKSGLFNFLASAGILLKWCAGILLVLMFIMSFTRILKRQNHGKLHWLSYFTPLIPLFLILVLNINFIAAFIVGLLYGFISTYRKNSLNLFVRSVLEGGAVVMPAVALMLGIGMLLNAVMGPGGSAAGKYSSGWPVLNLLQPVMTNIIPSSPVSYVLFFTLFAPLALYRGPLNVWGMGFGLAAVFLASGMNPGAIMGLLLSVGQIQGISDPTNTQNVWLANEMRVDVQKILWNTIPYTWIIAFLGLIISALLFM